MVHSEPSAQFRKLLSRRSCICPASVFDPISIRIAEELGFELAMLGGSVASLVVLGAPDLAVLSLTELADLARRICRASHLPLLVDADHGYGNAHNVKRTIEELEAAGVAALTIEDTVLPKPFRDDGVSRLVSVDEGVAKIRAAVCARRDPGLVILGRTSALTVTGMDDAIERAKAYLMAGADAAFFPRIHTRQQLDRLSDALRAPMILGSLNSELEDFEYLASRGVRVCLRGHLTYPAAVHAAYNALDALQRNRASPAKSNRTSIELMNRLTRRNDYTAWEREFVGGVSKDDDR